MRAKVYRRDLCALEAWRKKWRGDPAGVGIQMADYVDQDGHWLKVEDREEAERFISQAFPEVKIARWRDDELVGWIALEDLPAAG